LLHFNVIVKTISSSSLVYWLHRTNQLEKTITRGRITRLALCGWRYLFTISIKACFAFILFHGAWTLSPISLAIFSQKDFPPVILNFDLDLSSS